MFNYYISIGSNIRPEIHIPECINRLRREFKQLNISSVYETPPFGPAGDVNFWNLACCVKSELSEKEIREKMHTIETDFGREHRTQNKFAPRILDLDVLPKEGYQKQAFVMIPLAEINSRATDPLSGKTFGELAALLEEDARSFKKIKISD